MPSRRRVVAAAAILAVVPAVLRAQAKPRQIGFLGVSRAYEKQSKALVAGLRELGWLEGRHYTMQWRWADDALQGLDPIAAELVALNVDLIVTHSTPGTMAAKRATSAIPIVMTSVTDPLGTGLVSNMARPGGNLTGVTNLDTGLASKRLALLKDMVRNVRRVSVLRNPANPSSASQLGETQAAAEKLGIALDVFAARNAGELEQVLPAVAKSGASALVVLSDPVYVEQQELIAAFALERRLPSVFARNENVEAGGLLSYGPTLDDQFHQAAAYVYRILNGAKPGDLPVEQPTRFRLAVNVRTAKALGLRIPPSVLAQADQLIR